MVKTVPLREEGRQIKRLVKLPVMTRFVTFVGLPATIARTTLRVVDGIGLYVYHRSETVPSDDEIRRMLIGRERKYVYVEAASIAEALLRFPEQFPGAVTGERAFALELQPSEHWPIKIYPECSRMYETAKGYIVCGQPLPDQLNGEWGGCIIEGFEPPANCPIEKHF